MGRDGIAGSFVDGNVHADTAVGRGGKIGSGDGTRCDDIAAIGTGHVIKNRSAIG